MTDQGTSIVNQTVLIETRSGSRGAARIYASRILGADDATLTLALPYSQGKVLLFNAGQTVTLRLRDPGGSGNSVGEYPATVLERRTKPVPAVVVSRPGNGAFAHPSARSCRVIAVTSGKGGVGKTTVVVNLAIALAQMGHRVVVIDADLGTANVDVALNISAGGTIAGLIDGTHTIDDLLVEGPGGIKVLPGGSGIGDLANLNEWQFGRLLAQFAELESMADYILIDTGAGVSRNVTNFFLAADEILIVTAPEPPAIVDAYAILKVAAAQGRRHNLSVLVNRAAGQSDADGAVDNLQGTARDFLGLEVQGIGYLPEDPAVQRAVRAQTPCLLASPSSPASASIRRVATLLAGATGETSQTPVQNRKSFFHRLREMLSWT